jgi:threonine dehydratase
VTQEIVLMLDHYRVPLIRLGNCFPGKEVHAKCEFLAPSGCFKIRGATHLLEQLGCQGQRLPLIVPSMGNTAMGAAVGAKAYGFSMVGVVPEAISRAKDEKLQALGVELIKLAGGGSELLGRAREIAAQRKGYFVHPHLDPLWTNGYQLIAEEIFRDLPACRSLVFPVGGGGLLMGLTEYLRANPRQVVLHGCEAYNFPTYAAFHHGRSRTIADGLVLDVPHKAVQERIEEMKIDIHLVHDDDIRVAMAELYDRQGLIVEPSSAITTAFVQASLKELEGPVCVILTGGNITREDFDRLAQPPERGT